MLVFHRDNTGHAVGGIQRQVVQRVLPGLLHREECHRVLAAHDGVHGGVLGAFAEVLPQGEIPGEALVYLPAEHFLVLIGGDIRVGSGVQQAAVAGVQLLFHGVGDVVYLAGFVVAQELPQLPQPDCRRGKHRRQQHEIYRVEHDGPGAAAPFCPCFHWDTSSSVD